MYACMRAHTHMHTPTADVCGPIYLLHCVYIYEYQLYIYDIILCVGLYVAIHVYCIALGIV